LLNSFSPSESSTEGADSKIVRLQPWNDFSNPAVRGLACQVPGSLRRVFQRYTRAIPEQGSSVLVLSVNPLKLRLGTLRPASASDAGGSLHESGPRTSAILRSSLRWPKLMFAQVPVEFSPKTPVR